MRKLVTDRRTRRIRAAVEASRAAEDRAFFELRSLDADLLAERLQPYTLLQPRGKRAKEPAYA